MILVGIIENIVSNYLPYLACAMFAVIFIWTLSEKPVRSRIKNTVACPEQGKNETYY